MYKNIFKAASDIFSELMNHLVYKMTKNLEKLTSTVFLFQLTIQNPKILNLQ